MKKGLLCTETTALAVRFTSIYRPLCETVISIFTQSSNPYNQINRYNSPLGATLRCRDQTENTLFLTQILRYSKMNAGIIGDVGANSITVAKFFRYGLPFADLLLIANKIPVTNRPASICHSVSTYRSSVTSEPSMRRPGFSWKEYCYLNSSFYATVIQSHPPSIPTRHSAWFLSP